MPINDSFEIYSFGWLTDQILINEWDQTRLIMCDMLGDMFSVRICIDNLSWHQRWPEVTCHAGHRSHVTRGRGDNCVTPVPIFWWLITGTQLSSVSMFLLSLVTLVVVVPGVPLVLAASPAVSRAQASGVVVSLEAAIGLVVAVTRLIVVSSWKCWIFRKNVFGETTRICIY